MTDEEAETLNLKAQLFHSQEEAKMLRLELTDALREAALLREMVELYEQRIMALEGWAQTEAHS